MSESLLTEFPPFLLQRYYEASLIYKDVLKLESSSAEATQELKRAQTLHLMVGKAYVKHLKIRK